MAPIVRSGGGFGQIRDAAAIPSTLPQRLSGVRFRDEETQRAWKLDPVQNEAQARGRADFYEEYRMAIFGEVRSYEWKATE